MTIMHNDNGEQVVALARAVGLAGWAPAQTEEEKARVEAARQQFATPADEGAARVGSLARIYGLADWGPADTAEKKARDEALRQRLVEGNLCPSLSPANDMTPTPTAPS